jgi:uncharacterized RDD family membrane protein YckC
MRELARGLASPYAKADIGRRFCAVMVDSLFVMTGWFFYRQSESVLPLLAGLLYALLRDSTFGRSIGKFLFGLVVIDLETGRPCGRAGSAKRNVLFLLPGANLSAAFLEAVTIVRDPQGQRLGDRLAQTQVVEGFGARDLAAAFQRWWREFIAQLEGTPRRPRRVPVKSDLGQRFTDLDGQSRSQRVAGRIKDANP